MTVESYLKSLLFIFTEYNIIHHQGCKFNEFVYIYIFFFFATSYKKWIWSKFVLTYLWFKYKILFCIFYGLEI